MKNGNGKQSLRKYGIIFTMIFCCLLLGSTTSAEAASARKKAINAYRKLLSSNTLLEKAIDSFVQGEDDKKYYSFALANIDNNDVPELILYEGEYSFVLTYKNGKVKLVGDYFLQGVGSHFAYYPRKGVFREYDHFLESEFQTYIYLNNGNGKTLAIKEYFFDRFQKYTDGYSKKISRATFQKILKKKVGKTKLKQIKKFRKNTAANRKRYLK